MTCDPARPGCQLAKHALNLASSPSSCVLWFSSLPISKGRRSRDIYISPVQMAAALLPGTFLSHLFPFSGLRDSHPRIRISGTQSDVLRQERKAIQHSQHRMTTSSHIAAAEPEPDPGLRYSEDVKRDWDTISTRLVDSATLPFVFLLAPQVVKNTLNLLAKNSAALGALSWVVCSSLFIRSCRPHHDIPLVWILPCRGNEQHLRWHLHIGPLADVSTLRRCLLCHLPCDSNM